MKERMREYRRFVSLFVFLIGALTTHPMQVVADDTAPRRDGAATPSLSSRIDALKQDIRFEEKWDETLDKAIDTIQKFVQDLQGKGQSFEDLKRSFKAQGTRVMINSQLEPYFSLDAQGALQWGSALQFAGLPAQFAVPGLPALTPDAAVATLQQWRQQNFEKLRENRTFKARLDNLYQRLNDLGTEVNMLKTLEEKLDDATTKNREQIDIIAQINRTLKNEIFQENQSFGEQRRTSRISIQKFQSMLSEIDLHMDKLQKAYQAQARANDGAVEAKVLSCRAETLAESDSSLSEADLKSRLEAAEDQLTKAALTLKITTNELRAQQEFIESLRHLVNDLYHDQPLFQKFHQTKLKRKADIEKLINETRAKNEEVRKLDNNFQKILDRNRDDVSELSREVAEFRDKTINRDHRNTLKLLIDEVSNIEFILLNFHYNYTSIPVINKAHLSHIWEELRLDLELVDMGGIEARLKEFIQRGKKALNQLEKITIPGAFATHRGDEILAAAKACVDALKADLSERARAQAETEQIAQDALVAQTRAAIDTCDYALAREKLKESRDDDKKKELQDALDKGEKLYAKLKAKNFQAMAESDQCQYNNALKTFEEADAMAKCQKHKAVLQGNIDRVGRLKQHFQKIGQADAEASGMEQACQYDKALKKWQEAFDNAQCQTQKAAIGEKIKQATDKKNLKDRYKKEFDKGIEKVRSCDYTKALTFFKAARELFESGPDSVQCQRDLDVINNNITLARQKADARSTLKGLVNVQARALYDQCEFDQALATLEKALTRLDTDLGFAECRGDREKIEATKENVRERQTKGGTSCAMNDENINNAIVNVETDLATDDIQESNNQGTCRIKKYRDPLNPNKPGVILQQKKDNELILHVTNNTPKCVELATGIFGRGQSSWGQTVANSHPRCEGALGSQFRETMAGAEKICTDWRRKSAAPVNCQIMSTLVSNGISQGGGWKCVCEVGEPTKEACCAAPPADRQAAATINVFRRFQGCL